ncbi:MAG: hypothetical protein HUJ98_14250, partial [Bacteroidaceae bacterium]|nr:hypothetical protein [Bacteroidaceae bacterium]
QNWDFTTQSLATRATTLPDVFPGVWSEDYVLETVFDEQNMVKEIFSNFRENDDNRSKVVPFVFVVPDDNIVITPQFQGRNGWKNSELHMVVNDNGTLKDYVIWQSTVGMQIKKYENSNWTALDKDAGTTMYGTAGVEDAMNKTVYAVRSKELVIPKGTLPVGATITLYTKVSADGTYYWYSTNVKDSQTGTVKKFGNAIGYVEAKNPGDKVTYVACEGGSNKDCNDLIFKMEGVVPVPLREPYLSKVITAKRYMVEDLGATATSDIDFNDIVVDFVYSFDKEFEIVDKETDHAYIRLTGNTKNYVLTTTIRALGGVLDMELYTVNGNQENLLFKKSASTTVGNWTWNNLSALNYQTMYNTGWSSDPFHYNPKSADSQNSWIGQSEVKSDNPITLWEPDKNNIMIVVGSTGTTTSGGENDYSSVDTKS